MKRRILFICSLFIAFHLSAVGFILNSEVDYIEIGTLIQSDYEVEIENQIAQIKSTETFVNQNEFSLFLPRLYFPIPANASATKIRWFTNNEWQEAVISPTPQNPVGGPSEMPAGIISYLQNSIPIIFDIPADFNVMDTLIVELNYMQLLPYSNGNVDLILKNDYNAIDEWANTEMMRNLSIELNSDRIITDYDLLAITNEVNTITPNQATTQYYEQFYYQDYNLRYTLSPEDLGIWAMSNYLDSVPDNAGNGFFTMIVEPDPSENTEVIQKVFTLIIDRSGSMIGNKIMQAKEAATYIVNNLNEGDQFNLITFAYDVTPLWTSHQVYNESNKQEALTFISYIIADGSTNISGAFELAVPQFAVADSSTANIIIFMTDGEQTEGILDTDQLITYINNLIVQTETNINLFNFGIGSSVNTPLLSITANQNNGISVFLGNNELYSVLTGFYSMIRNPVLLYPSLTFYPEGVITDIHPINLPNLYKGNQMIISGRYSEPVSLNLTFSGMTYNQPVSYQYSITLSDSNQTKYAFLTKIWAKQKIDDLMIQYYTYPANSTQANEIKQQIIDLSIMWGVLSPFTSFIGGEVSIDEEVEAVSKDQVIQLKGNYPNPFNPSTTICFAVTSDLNELAEIKIYNLKGQLVKTLFIQLNGKGDYSVFWDGLNELNKSVSSGVYLYKISCRKHHSSGKMILIK